MVIIQRIILVTSLWILATPPNPSGGLRGTTPGFGVLAEKPSVNLRGAGASFPAAVYIDWQNSYRNYRHHHVTLNMTYESRGSTYGRTVMMGLKDGVKVEYGGSDYKLSEAEHEKHPDLALLPTMAGAVVFGYNFGDNYTSNRTLLLSIELAVGIYNGTYKYWNDTAIKALNKEIQLPNERIVVIARKDSSGTTHTVTSAFSTIQGWRDRYGTFTKGWNQLQQHVTYLAKGNRGMSGFLLSLDYSIGYLVVADAKQAKLSYADLRNKYGEVVSPTQASVQNAMEKAAGAMHTELTAELSDHQDRNSYPIASFTYMIVRMRDMQDCNSARELLRYISWFMVDEKATKACTDKHMVPISTSIKNRIKKHILFQLECHGQVLWPSVSAQMAAEEAESDQGWILPSIVGFSLFAVLLSAIGIYGVVRYIRKERELNSNDWDIPIEDIVFYSTAKSTTGNQRFVMWPSIRSLTDIDELEDGYQMVKNILQWPGKWNGQNVGLRILEIKDLIKVKKTTKVLIMNMRDNIIHNNVLNLHGLTEIQSDRYVVSGYCSKGSLSDLLRDSKYLFNKDCKFALTIEIISGLAFLHSKGIVHGNLRTSSCLVDFKWTVKIADWEYCHLYTHLNPKKNPLLSLRKTVDEVGHEKAAFLDFWTAPELLKSGSTVHPTSSCDVFSFSIIVQEIFTREDPYAEYLESMQACDLLKAILSNNLRPSHADDTPTSIRQIMEYGWSEIPSSRPTTEQISKMLRNAHNVKKSVLDHMVEASEEYTLSLEEQLRHNKELLSETEHTVSQFTERTMPAYMLRKLASVECPTPSIEFNSNACIIALSFLHNNGQRSHGNERRRKSSTSDASNWLEQVDSRLQRIATRFKSLLIDYTNGVYLLVYGIGLKDKRKAIHAARMTFEVLEEGHKQQSTPSSSSESPDVPQQKYTVKCAMHFGCVSANIVQNTVPRCLMTGDAIGETHRLLQYSEPCKVLISKAYRDALTVFSLQYFRIEANQSGIRESGYLWPGETFWIYRKPNSEYTKWTRIMSSVERQHHNDSSLEDVLSSKPSRTSYSSSSQHSHLGGGSSTEDELPVVARINSMRMPQQNAHILSTQLRPMSNSSHKPLTSSTSFPLANQQQPARTPSPSVTSSFGRGRWGSLSGKLNRSVSFTAGTLASLRQFLNRTLPAASSYRMNIISSNEDPPSDVSLDEPTLDALPL